MKSKSDKKTRREFMVSATAFGALPFFTPVFSNFSNTLSKTSQMSNVLNEALGDGKSIIGNYGPWAADLANDPLPLSFRNNAWSDIESWKEKALAKTKELVVAPPKGDEIPKSTIKKTYEYDGLIVEELEWQLPYGRKTEAILLKPANAKGPLPAVLGLHDHAGNKYFGKRKITKTSDQPHPMMVKHQEKSYSGNAWANDLAKKGYVVLVHDTFTFASRRVQYKDITSISWGACKTIDKTDENPERQENIDVYNTWATAHEHIMSKSLFSGGTTWPGVTLYEDQKALDVLCNRPDVDAEKVGCCGLSGGGLRTNYLGGLDERIKCAVSVGFMTTWRDFIMNKSYTHTWMTYTPVLPNYLEFPEILGLRVPLPTMALSSSEDHLYTLPEMKRANTILEEIFAKAGAADKYSGKFYPGDHKFDTAMQKDAFDWFDKWLKI